jgi:MFS-type transporter involved in bile tolerance (Atg22 family)
VLSGLSAALPQVVAERRLVTANAFTTTLGAGATTVGGFASVALREVWGKDDDGAAWTALTACLVYAGTAVLASRLARRRLGPTDEVVRQPLAHALATVSRGLREGAVHVRERPVAARALLAITAHRFFSGVAFVATLLLYTAHGYLHRGFYGLGQVLTATVVGGLAAALLTPRVTRRVGTQRWIVTVLTGAAAAEVVFGAPYTHEAFLVCALGLGFAAQAAKICVDTLVQESIEDAYRGRVFSLYDMLFNVSFVASAGLAAVLVPDNGKSYLVVGLVAGGYLLTAVGYGVLLHLRSAGEPPEPVMAAGAA